MASITVDLRPGDRLRLGAAVVEFQHKSGRAARVRVTAPQDLPVKRETPPEESEFDSVESGSNHASMNT